jgi:hypothetical protein
MAASLDERNMEMVREVYARPTMAITCPATTIDAFCRERGVVPDVIKIDVEGFETAVLRSAEHALHRPVAVICEVHPAQLAVAGSSIEELESLVAAAGLELTPFDEPNIMGIFHALARR